MPMASTPLVTVIVSLYNYGRYIEECLASILSQSHRHLQVIVINNGSQDDGPDKVARCADPRLELHHIQVNRGAERACNFAYTLAKGEWVCFFPADDRMHPDFLNHMLAAGLERDRDLVGCWMNVINAQGMPDEKFAAIYETANNHEDFDFADFRRFRWENPLNANAFLWKRSLLDQCMPMQEDVMCSDWGLFIRAARKRCRTTILNERLLDYRMHGTNLGLRTPSQEYLVHFFYLHLTEYRLTAAQIAEDPDKEIRTCHEEMITRVMENVTDPAVQARLIMASETGIGALARWPDLAAFREYLTAPAAQQDLHFESLKEFFSKYALPPAALASGFKTTSDLFAEVERGKVQSSERGVRLREELDRAKEKIEHLRQKVDEAKRSREGLWSRTMRKLRGAGKGGIQEKRGEAN